MFFNDKQTKHIQMKKELKENNKNKNNDKKDKTINLSDGSKVDPNEEKTAANCSKHRKCR